MGCYFIGKICFVVLYIYYYFLVGNVRIWGFLFVGVFLFSCEVILWWSKWLSKGRRRWCENKSLWILKWGCEGDGC